MSNSSIKGTSTATHISQSPNTANNTKQNDGLSASAPAFVPRTVTTEHHQQQDGRGLKGHGDRGRQQRGGLSQAMHNSREDSGQQRHHHHQPSGRGGGRQRPQGPRPHQQQQQQLDSQLRHQTHHYQQQQQRGQETDDADAAAVAAGSSPDRSSSRAAVNSRGRAVAANHLLNFQYDNARSTRGGRGGAGGPRGGGTGGPSSSSAARRRYPAPRPQRYDKQKFLQANFRFLVSSTLDRRQFESDADRMFDWDDVILVDMMSSTPIQCPISLDSPPSCPQITPCGHVYSFGSIMQHLMNHGGEQLRRSAPCPLCYQPVVARELRLVQVRQVPGVPSVGSTVTFQLLRRPKASIIPAAVTTATAMAAATGKYLPASASTAADADAGPAAVFSPGSTPSSKWGNKAPAASSSSSTPAANPAAAAATSATLSTPLSDNLYAKFATCSDPRPLWRASAQQLGQQLALILSQGGMEAEIEAPALFAAADSLANRARRFAEHQATQLLQRGVPGATIGAPSAAGDGAAVAGSSWPIWLKEDPQAAGQDAEQLVRDAFTLALDGSKAALVAREQQQQVQQRIQQEFPQLAANTPPRTAHQPSAAAATPPTAAPTAAAPGPVSSPRAQQQQRSPRLQQERQHSLPWSEGDAEEQPATELCFDHAFSEEEDDQQQQEQEQAGNTIAAAPVGAADPGNSSSGASRAVGVPAGKTVAGGGDAAGVFGTSPGTSHILGSSPNTSQMNTANQSGDFYMYQSSDGQWVYLHPLNLRCLLHAFGSYGACPSTVTGKLLEIEDVVQDDASRRRWKFLGHLPLNGTFHLAEVQLLDPNLTAEQLAPFTEELAAREKRRKRRADAVKRESRREAAAAAAAQKAKQGPTAAELRAMPRLGGIQGPAGAGDGGEVGLDLTGLTADQIDEAVAAQVMHDSALAAGVSPPTGGVSFAKMAKLGFAASGPALGASPGDSSEGGLGPAPAAAAAPKGAWGSSSSSGKSAAARLSGQGGPSVQKPAWGASSSSASSSGVQQPAVVLGKSSWAAGSAAGAKAAAGPSEPSSSSSAAATNWLVLGGGGAGAAGGGEEGSAEGGNVGPNSSKKGKKEKKGMMLFSTSAQRKY